MDNVTYTPLDIKHASEERGQNGNSRCSVPPGILPGVHELIAQTQSYPSGPPYVSYHSNISQTSHLVYNQTYPSLPYSNSGGLSNIRCQNSIGVSSNLQYQNSFKGSNICSNPSPVVYEGEPTVYPPSADVQLSLVHQLQQKHETGSSWFSNRFAQDHHVQALGSSQWLSDSFSVGKLPIPGYGSGGLHGQQFVSTCQTHVLGPVQQPEVQPIPPCFWTDRLKSQTLHPLPRPISSVLETPSKPQVLHQAKCSYGLSQIKHCACSGFSANPSTLYHKTYESGQHVCHDSQLYNVSYVNNAFKASVSPQYHIASVGSSQTASASLPVTTRTVGTRECVGVLGSKNVLDIDGVQTGGKQSIQLDENSNFIYSTSINMLPIERMEQKCEYDHTVEKYKEDEDTSVEEENLNTSVIEEYIQSAPDFQSLSQIHIDKIEVKEPKMGQTASTSISRQDCVKNSSPVVSLQTDSVKSECIQNIKNQGNSGRKDPPLKTSFTKTKRKCKRGFSQLDNLANRLENSVIGIRNRSNQSQEDGKVAVACSSSSSEISPITADHESPSTNQSMSRRRSYRSRNFSKEFFNRWSSFEDVPLVISRQPDYRIMCSTPKNNSLGGEDPDKGFSCDTCGKSFFSHYSYTRHVKKHKVMNDSYQRKVVKPRDVYRCSPCNMTWVSHDQFIFHSQCHMSEGLQLSVTEDNQQYQPKLDGSRQDSISDDKRQMITKPSKQNQRYICSVCGDSLSDSYEYNLHCSKHGRTDDIMSSNESDSSFSSPRYFHCGVCDVKFVNRFMYSKHCVSEKHRSNQKIKGTEISDSNVSDAKILGKLTEVDQAVDIKLSSSGKGDSAGNDGQYKPILENPNSDAHYVRKNKVQSGLPNKFAKELSEMIKYNNTVKTGADLVIQRGGPISTKCNLDSSDNTNPHKEQSLKRSSNSAVNCRFLFLKAKNRGDKSRHIKTGNSEDVKQSNLVCNQTESSSVSNACHNSAGNGGTYKGVTGSLDENNNPTDVPKCSDHLLSNKFVPSSKGVHGLCYNVTDGLNTAKSSVGSSSAVTSDTGNHLAVSNYKCSASESSVANHYAPVSTAHLQRILDAKMPLVTNVSNFENISQLKPAENGSQANSSELQTDDSGLETSGEMYNGEYPMGWSSQNSRLDADKTLLVDFERNTMSNGLDSKSRMMSNKTGSGQEDTVALKGDSGLWSDEEMGTFESGVEENTVMANHKADGLEECSRKRAIKDDQEHLLQDNALKSKDWGIDIVDTSVRSSEMEVCDLESTQAILTEDKNVIALEVKYDGKANSLDLGESVEIVVTNNFKHLSTYDHRSDDSPKHQELLSNLNIAAEANNNALSTEDKSRISIEKYNKNDALSEPQFIHNTRQAKQSRPALLLDGDFHNGKIYFCEICEETFVNPFRYSAHYKKRAHMELASRFSYRTISGVNVSREVKEKGQTPGKQQDDNGFRRVKNLKKRRKRRKSKIHRASSSKVNIKSLSASKLVKHSQTSQTGYRKMERKWCDRILNSKRLKKPASSNKLKNLKSKLIRSRHYNLRLAKHSKKTEVSEIKISFSENNNLTCMNCSVVFQTEKELHLHVCSEKTRNTPLSGSVSGGLEIENSDVTTADKEKLRFDGGQLDEQPLKKRKPVVKCPALFKMLTGAKQVENGQSCSTNAYKHTQKSKRKRLCSKKKNSGVNSNLSRADRLKLISKPRKSYTCLKTSKTESSVLIKNSDQTESIAIDKKPDQAEAMSLAKKPKLSSSLLRHDKNTDKKSKSQEKSNPQVNTSEEDKPAKPDNTKHHEFCEVCEKFYSSKSHLYRHYKTIIHRQHMQAKKKKLKNQVS